jgi:hypothetical protein
VLWLPLGFLGGIVNVWGWPNAGYFVLGPADGDRMISMDVLTHALLVGRVRLLLLSLGATLWLTSGATALYALWRQHAAR